MGNGFKISLILVFLYIGTAIYELSKNIALHSVGKYQFHISKDQAVTRLDTETGEVDICSLAIANSENPKIEKGDILCFTDAPPFRATKRHTYKEFLNFNN